MGAGGVRGKRNSTNRGIASGEAAMASPAAKPTLLHPMREGRIPHPARLANAACDMPLRSYSASSS
jgi:hypothetical protein